MKIILSLIIFIFLVSDCYGSKKGTTFGSDSSSDAAKCNDIRDLKVGWYYNWDKKVTCNANVPGVEFVPTIWGKGSLPIGNLPANTQWLIGFNEPNYRSQSNMSPKEAADLWPQLEATGKKLVAPGVADCGQQLGGDCTYSTLDWYKQFLGNCSNCRIDAVSLHLYYCNADDMMNKINNLYQLTKKPVWLTEFACNNPTNQDSVVNFAKALLPRLENSTQVDRYSWFIPFCGGCHSTDLLYSSLYNDQTGNGNLTPIGKYYSSFQTNSSNSSGSSSNNNGSGSNNNGSSSSSSENTTGNLIKSTLTLTIILIFILLL
ncbi:hypothetical protein RB653_006020 [Dictyostelium firmibasis]|uniref:Asl1-like glycosyl hydrolase catalytic domain-containing protein n=1 Tax=Dictyostelium firmibasis TaxID=79012 RepID=A0AAN7U2B0_9MYCE